MSCGDLPVSFLCEVKRTFPNGAAWLEQLPGLLESCKQRWRLEVAGDPFPLSYNYVVPVSCANGESAVLKLGVPNSELRSEVSALRAYGGKGAARLLDSDEEIGALLMERIAPGRVLTSLGDEKRATAIAAETMLKLWKAKPDPAEFRDLEDWTSGLSKLRARFSGGTGPIDPELVDAAERLRAELLPSCSEAALLHGDLHHLNILEGRGDEWFAIDPKGVMAEPAYEPAAFLLNPDPATCLDREIQKTRIDIFVEALHLDRERILAWAFFHSVLSTWWTIESGAQVRESHNAKARLLRSLLR